MCGSKPHKNWFSFASFVQVAHFVELGHLIYRKTYVIIIIVIIIIIIIIIITLFMCQN